jgi:hypothetical protein
MRYLIKTVPETGTSAVVPASTGAGASAIAVLAIMVMNSRSCCASIAPLADNPRVKRSLTLRWKFSPLLPQLLAQISPFLDRQLPSGVGGAPGWRLQFLRRLQSQTQLGTPLLSSHPRFIGITRAEGLRPGT